MIAGGRVAARFPVSLSGSCAGLDSDRLETAPTGDIARCEAELRQTQTAFSAFDMGPVKGTSAVQVKESPVCEFSNVPHKYDTVLGAEVYYYPLDAVKTCLRRANIALASMTDSLPDWQRAGFSAVEIEAEAGKTYYAKCRIARISGFPTMQWVDAATGSKEIRGLHLTKYRTPIWKP